MTSQQAAEQFFAAYDEQSTSRASQEGGDQRFLNKTDPSLGRSKRSVCGEIPRTFRVWQKEIPEYLAWYDWRI